ncbi:MAG: TolC family protein [Verrucomicrobia bacterium]|nr:TolC family protein [Verrucomicrobiota bacterium]MCH8528309.1 TolC family protein [Kiritimatiellia bacterium]
MYLSCLKKTIVVLFSFACVSAPALRADPDGPRVWSLEALQDYALNHAPGLERQRLGYENLIEAVTIARTKFDPVFTARQEWQDDGDAGRTQGSVRQTLPADLQLTATASVQDQGDRGDLTRYAIQLSKTLLGGGSLLESRISVIRAMINEAREFNRLSLEQRRVRFSVTRQFFDVIRSQQTLRLREMQLERAKLNLEHALVREDPLDIATARLRIPESELDVAAAERQISSGLLNLKTEIGFPLSEELRLEPDVDFAFASLALTDDLAYALENHELLLNNRLELELLEKELRVARSRRFPEVTAQVSHTTSEFSGENERDSETRGEVVVTWPWLNRRDRAEARQKQNELDSAIIGYSLAQNERRRDIEVLHSRVLEAERSVGLQEERVEVLEQQLRLFQDRWENGEIGILEYIRSQNNLEDAQVQRITQQLRYLELVAEYRFSVGH